MIEHYLKARAAIVVPMLLLLLLAGCTTTPTSINKANVKLESVDSRSARIVHTYLQVAGDTMILHGRLVRRLPARGAIPGYLHVELMGPDRKVMKEADVGYRRNNIRSRYAYFSLRLPDALALGSTVRITHNDMRSQSVEPVLSPWQDVDDAQSPLE